MLALRTRALSLTAAVLLGVPAAAQEPPAKVDFAAEIQPLLQARCVKCHGAKKQEGDLRLDQRRFVFHAERDLWTVIPGDAEGSVVVERITLPADDPDIMPAEGDPLTPEQIALVRRWIDEGAEWPESADRAVLEQETRRRAREVIELPELDAAQREAEAAAFDALRAEGVLVSRIAANTIAVEVDFGLLGPQVTDAQLALLKGLEPTLVWLRPRSHAGHRSGPAAARGVRPAAAPRPVQYLHRRRGIGVGRRPPAARVPEPLRHAGHRPRARPAARPEEARQAVPVAVAGDTGGRREAARGAARPADRSR
ncbi:MAG: hypothetical protein IPM29_18345 [Planctomycetes bacterium]|nr:hypothetical protein [Planctomycetota bacterium]